MDGLTSWFRTLLEISLAMSLVMALLLLCRPFFKTRYRAKWAYWAWLLVAVRLLIPLNLSLPSVTPVSIPEPGVSVNLPVAFARKNKAPVEDPRGQYTADGAPVGAVSGDVMADDPLPIKATVVMDGWTVVAWVWLTGFVCALILQFVPYFRFRRQVGRWSRALAAPEFDALCGQLGAQGLRLAACDAVSSPMVSGFLRPALLVPTEGALPPEPILRHEIIHYKRRDLWYKLLLLICQCVHWFNPLVWLMGAAAGRDLERACDEAVTAGRDEEYRECYGRAILDAVDAAQPERAPLTSYFHGGKHAMLERLASILNTEGKKRGTAVLALLLAAVVLGTACFAVGRPVIVEDNEFKITLPSGMTWVGPEQKPGLTAQFYQNGVEVGGLESIEGTLTRLGGSVPYPPESEQKYDSDLSGAVLAAEEMTLQRGMRDVEQHYYVQIAENQICHLWFRLDAFSKREAEEAAESFLKNLGASHSKSPDGRYDISYLLTENGSRWLLRDRGELVGAATTPGTHVWQTAQWSPNGQWASARSDDGIVILTPGTDSLSVKAFTAAYDDTTPIGWGADDRLQFSYVLKSEAGLEGGTAWYDPAADAVGDQVAEVKCAPVNYTPAGVSSVRMPEWTLLLPRGVETVWDGSDRGDAALTLNGEKIGVVRWVELSAGEKAGRIGLSKLYSDWENSGAAFGYTFPVADGEGYELVLKASAIRQDLANAVAEAFLVDGKPAYRFTYDGAAGDAVTLTVGDAMGDADVTGTLYNGTEAEVMYGSPFSLQVWKDGAWETVGYADGERRAFSSVGYLLKPDESREKRYPIQEFYGVLPAGQYRIREEYSVTVGFTGKQSEPVAIYGQFNVG